MGGLGGGATAGEGSAALQLADSYPLVPAGLTLDWSSASIEGSVNRMKRTKRKLYD